MSGDVQASGIRRLTLDQLDPRLQEELGPRVARLGYLGELFAVTGHQPDALLALMNFASVVRAPFDAPTVELVMLTVSSATGNRYEQYQHERLAQRLGCSTAWIAEAVSCRPAQAGMLSPEQRAIQHLALSAVRNHGQENQSALTEAVNVLGDQATVGLLLLIAYAVSGSVLANALGLVPPVAPLLGQSEA